MTNSGGWRVWRGEEGGRMAEERGREVGGDQMGRGGTEPRRAGIKKGAFFFISKNRSVLKVRGR